MSLSSRKQAKLVEKIRGLAKESGNKKCFICQRMGPHSNVVVSPLHVFVCTQCAGIHRNFSHRVKGISAASFSEDEVGALEANGNKRERRKWLGKYKESDCPIDDESSPAQVQKFMSRMFEKKEWYSSKPIRRHEHLKKSPASNSSRHRTSRRHRERRDTRTSADAAPRSDDEQSDSALSTSSRQSNRRADRRRRDDRDRRSRNDTPRSQTGGRQRRSSTSSETPRSAASPKNGSTLKDPKEEKPKDSGLVDLLDDLILTPGFGMPPSKSAELDDTMLGEENDKKASGVPKDADDDFDEAAFPSEDSAFGGGANGASTDAKKSNDAFSHLVPAIQDNSLHTNGPTSANFESGITHLLSVLSQVQMQYQFSDLELKNACRSALERIQKQNAAMVQSRVMAAQTGAYVAPPGMFAYGAGGPPPGAQMMSPHPGANGAGPGGAGGGDPFGDGGDNPFEDASANGAQNSQMAAAGAWSNARAQFTPQAAGGYGGGFGHVVSQVMPQAVPAEEEDEDANNPFA